MNDFEIVAAAMLIFAYGATCYLCGKGDLLNLVPLMLQEWTERLKAKNEIVHCMDCDWYKLDCESCGFWPDEGYRDPEHFCGEGKRRET